VRSILKHYYKTTLNVMLKTIIIEDEPASLANLKSILNNHCQDIKVIASAGSIKEGYTLLTNPAMKPDLVLMDINLEDGVVFQLLDQLPQINFEIIFVTAYEKYAVQACNYSCIGFVPKPIDPSDLVEAIERVRLDPGQDIEERLGVLRGHVNNLNPFKKITIPSIDEIHFVHINEIVRLQSDDNYTIFHKKNGQKIVASKTIRSFEEMFIPFNFFRVHRSHLINLNYIKKFVRGGGSYVLMEDGLKIEVARRRKPLFIEKLKSLQKTLAE